MIDKDKRWRHREERWRRPEDGVFKPEAFAVDVLEADGRAKAFVESQHYSASYPAARFRAGLFGPNAELVGVAVFSQPTNNGFLPKWAGLHHSRAVELGRFVLVDSVAFNGESWFLARAFKLLRTAKPGVEAVVSCADPVERTSVEGQLTKPAHYGTIYQASNAVHVGRTERRWVVLAPDGTIVNERTLSKIRAEDRGWEYGYRQLLAHGAPPRDVGESLRGWVARVLALPLFRRVQHPGNLVYSFGFTRMAKQRIAALHGMGLPYVKSA